MPKSLDQIKKQIAALEAQAEAITKKEVGVIIAGIKKAIAYYGLTAADLGLAGKGPKVAKAAKPGRKPARKKAGKSGVVKYRDEAGNTWTGHGRRPQWFVAAIESGKEPGDLLA